MRSFNKRQDKRQGGLTVVGSFIFIGLALMTALVGYVSFQKFYILHLLGNEVGVAKDAFYQAHSYANDHKKPYGVHITDSSFIIFPGEDFDKNSPNHEIEELNEHFTIQNLILEYGGRDLVYYPNTRGSHESGMLTIVAKDNPTIRRVLHVKKNGVVTIMQR